MSTFVYSGSVAEALGLNRSPSVELYGGGEASGLISSVVAKLTFSTTASANTYPVTVTLHFDGGSKSVTQNVKLTASNATGGQVSFTFGDLTVEQANSISSVSVSCSGSNSGKIFLKGDQSVVVEYLVLTACTPPITVTVERDSVAPGGKVTLSWSDAEAGDNNPITGYQIFRASAPDGPYSLLTAVGSTTTAGSVTVVAPTANGAAYYYKVQTVGTYDGFSSSQSAAYAGLACSFASTGAPSTLKVATTNVAPAAKVVLSWSGASAGDNNPVTGYEVHRSDSAEGTYSLLATVESTATAAELEVVAPTGSGVTHYYKVRTVGTLEGCDSELSTAYTSLTCTYSAPGAPTRVTLDGAGSVYALPGSELTLAWSGASAGANNPITGYNVVCTDEVGAISFYSVGPDVTSCAVPAHDVAGKRLMYTVVVLGELSNSAASEACTVYSYTDPTAPAAVTVSDETPAAGVRVRLFWDGAGAGGYNAITGYRVYRSATVNGEATLVTTVSSTEPSGSCYVDAPARQGGVYYFRVETVGSYSGSGQSTAYASVTAGESIGADSEIEVEITPRKPREKRGFIFGDYDTAAHGWTLSPGWSFAEPETQTNYVDVPGRSAGPLDHTTALTGGDPRYGSRPLSVTFECSEGTRLAREALISYLVNLLHGQREKFYLPDDRTRYAVGRFSVKKLYSDLAHAAIQVEAVCEPWRYSKQERSIELLAAETARVAVLPNDGRRWLVPELAVTGHNASVTLQCGALIWTLAAGEHILPDLILKGGNTLLTYSGTGTVSIKYREAIL